MTITTTNPGEEPEDYVPPRFTLPLEEPTQQELEALAAFAPELSAPGFTAGEWKGGDKNPDGSISFPWFHLGEAAERLATAVYELGFVSAAFPWADWRETDEAMRLFEDHTAIAGASAMDLSRMLTTILRADRLCEGTFVAELNRGTVLAIVRRAGGLISQNTGAGKGT